VQIFAIKVHFMLSLSKQVVSNKYDFAGIFAGMFNICTPPPHVVFVGLHCSIPLYRLNPAVFGILLL
jgi:sodium/potassium-transporting ATPase subunit alpha